MSSFKVIKTQYDDQLESHTSLRTQIKEASMAGKRHDALLHENKRIRLELASVCKLLDESHTTNSVLQADLRHVNNKLQNERRLAKQREQMLRNENIMLQRGYDEFFDVLVKACQALAMDDQSRPEHEVVVERLQRVRRMDARVVRRIERRWHRSTGMNSVQIIERQAHQLWSQQETLKRVRSERNTQQDWLTQCLQDLERLSAIVRTANQPLVDASGAKDGEALCAICLVDSGDRVLEDDDQLVTLYCNHRYCRPCLAKWTSKNRTCPTCRRYIGRHR
ncbi:hypothetical protein BGW42_008396 [Actinomortierella wolfii]|nr:hypothetical protein BGW42_008396 [Actinomortierella wolfii]